MITILRRFKRKILLFYEEVYLLAIYLLVSLLAFYKISIFSTRSYSIYLEIISHLSIRVLR